MSYKLWVCLLYTSSYQTSIDMICTSEVGVSVSIDNVKHLNEILDDLKKYGTVTVDKDMCLSLIHIYLMTDVTVEYAPAITND